MWKVGFLTLIVAVCGYFGYRHFIAPRSALVLGETPSSSLSPIPSSLSSPMSTPDRDVYQAAIRTSKGDIVLELYASSAPHTVANFIKLSNIGFYNGTRFHRVIKDFVIQGGDPYSRTLPLDDERVGTGGPGYTFADEINPRSLGLPQERIAQLEEKGYTYTSSIVSIPVDTGVIAMANGGPNTNGSQFFIVTGKPQPQLDGMHTVFGRVVQGLDVARAIVQGDSIEKIIIQ